MEPSEVGRALAGLRRHQAKTCEVCGKKMEGLKRLRYCSPACQSKAYRARNKEEVNRRARQRYYKRKGEGATGDLGTGDA